MFGNVAGLSFYKPAQRYYQANRTTFSAFPSAQSIPLHPYPRPASIRTEFSVHPDKRTNFIRIKSKKYPDKHA